MDADNSTRGLVEVNSTTAVPAGSEDASWGIVLVAFKVVNTLKLIFTAWIFICVIVYGTKAGRWSNRPGTSSLNSGVIYSVCAVAIGMLIPRLVATQVLYQLTRIGLKNCELVADVGNGTFSASIYSFYFFLWLKERYICANPYVKRRIGAAVKWISVSTFAILTLFTIGLTWIFITPNWYRMTTYGCILRRNQTGNIFPEFQRKILFGVGLILPYCLILCLLIYTAFRVKFRTGGAHQEDAHGPAQSDIAPPTRTGSAHQEGGHGPAEIDIAPPTRTGGFHQEEGHGPVGRDRTQGRTLLLCCGSLRSTFFGTLTSPIEMDVRRTLFSGVIMVSSDILTMVISSTTLSRTCPVALRQTIYDTGLFVNVFCVLATLGDACRILTFLCPKFHSLGGIRKHFSSRETENVVMEENSL